MKYWLMTWDTPDGEILDGEWGLYIVKSAEGDEEFESVIVVEYLLGDDEYKPGDVEIPFDDSVTSNEKRVISFIFDQGFW